MDFILRSSFRRKECCVFVNHVNRVWLRTRAAPRSRNFLFDVSHCFLSTHSIVLDNSQEQQIYSFCRMARLGIRSLLLLCALAVISRNRVASFRACQQNAIVRSFPTVPYPSYTQGVSRKTTLPILLKATKDDAQNPAPEDYPYDYDLAVIGAGPVGVQAAIAAAGRAKKRVVLIDAPRASGQLMNEETNEDLSLGGPTGLFSKALRDAGKRIKVSTLRGMGLREDSIWNEITGACIELASFNARDIKRQLEYAGVTFIEGYAKFEDSGGSHRLIVSQDESSFAKPTAVTTVSTDKVLIATGSRPFQPSNIPFDGVRVFDSDSINGLGYLPKSVVITGR